MIFQNILKHFSKLIKGMEQSNAIQCVVVEELRPTWNLRTVGITGQLMDFAPWTAAPTEDLS